MGGIEFELKNRDPIDVSFNVSVRADGGSGGGYNIGPGLKLDAETNTLSVDTADAVEKDNTKPVTSAAVYTEVGTIKRAASDLWDTAQNTPDAAPALWEDIAYKQGFRIIPETITAGLAFSKGEKGWWQDELYESLLAANVWNPSVNPDGWKKITEEGT